MKRRSDPSLPEPRPARRPANGGVHHPALLAWLAGSLVFLVLDATWLTCMGPRLYQPALSHLLAAHPDPGAAALFYLVYLVALHVLVVEPSWRSGHALPLLGRCLVFSIASYATYDLTNQATLAGWPWKLTAIDLAWGCVVSCSAAASMRMLRRRWTGMNG